MQIQSLSTGAIRSDRERRNRILNIHKAPQTNKIHTTRKVCTLVCQVFVFSGEKLPWCEKSVIN